MVTYPELDRVAKRLTDALVRRGRVPEVWRSDTESILREELIAVVRGVAREVAHNAGCLLASEKLLGLPNQKR